MSKHITRSPSLTTASDDDAMGMTLPDLERRLGEFEQYLTEEDLAASARFSYVDQAGRFIRWLAGDYRPRNAAASPSDARTRRGHAWTLGDLRRELAAYRRELEAAKMRPQAINTYVNLSGTFVRWLDGAYTARGRHGRQTRIDDDDSWLEEASIQAHVVRWLERDGWKVVREAVGREHGTDIDAERGDERLSVEVKGHPRKVHVFGVNIGQARKWHPGAQARTYYGNAVHTVLAMLHADPGRGVAIALPDLPVYRGLVERSRDPLTRLGVAVWFVARDGTVTIG